MSAGQRTAGQVVPPRLAGVCCAPRARGGYTRTLQYRVTFPAYSNGVTGKQPEMVAPLDGQHVWLDLTSTTVSHLAVVTLPQQCGGLMTPS